ncbi:pyridoxamine 5'-phosphate oxidase family protein [Paraclostridium sordellii]|uniref:pyridoxamine 5'-phosphate oxidase family protein n=1 Tax=Paraclostridium sordellii TaxID=1505 RepID=UPI0005E9F7A3|nr:pyridoxamine 5'-phosphate oxidase family protein [Paeniclostridium sordellii]CEO28886.1 putative nitroimidazole resistance protein NimA [[Clostridium] sordellii] [Paeniclostridium sordellii]
MFKEMRRKKRELELNDIEKILENGEYGNLATVSENGYPYSLPISYVYYDDSIYFHCAKKGHKLDNIVYNKKVSFSVVGDTEVLPDKFSTKYESVIIFGEAVEVYKEEKEIVLLKLIEKYSKDFLEEGKKYISKAKDATNIVKIKIIHITGKGIR